MYLVTADEMRRMDRATIETLEIPGRVLMENAGRGATVHFLETLYRHQPGRVGIAAGRGNNGGDGFVMARYLHQKGIPVTVFLFTHRDRIQGDAAINLALIDHLDVPVIEVADTAALDARKQDLARIDLWVDAILGTGLTSDVRGLFRPVIEFINHQKRPVFAVDISSGLNADSGQVCGVCIQATATATFGFAKIGHFTYPGRSHTGQLKVIEIGIPPQMAVQVGCRQHLITPADLKPALPVRQAAAHKGNSGHLLVLAGSPGKTGAAAMTAMTAMRSGAGLVTLGIPQSLNPVLETMVTEAMTVGLSETPHGQLDESAFQKIVDLMTDKRCLAVGPGLGTDPSTGRLLNRLMENTEIPLVVDADGLNLIAGDLSIFNRKKAPMVLTPHPGEMARLCGQSTVAIQSDRVAQARRFAEQHGVYLVLKGAATVIAQPDGFIFINPTGNPGMAAGGMGDVLTGLIAGLITQGMPIDDAVRAGVYLHGAAADRLLRSHGALGYLATEVMSAVPATLAELLGSDDWPMWPDLDPLCYRIAPPHGA